LFLCTACGRTLSLAEAAQTCIQVIATPASLEQVCGVGSFESTAQQGVLENIVLWMMFS